MERQFNVRTVVGASIPRRESSYSKVGFQRCLHIAFLGANNRRGAPSGVCLPTKRRLIWLQAPNPAPPTPRSGFSHSKEAPLFMKKQACIPYPLLCLCALLLIAVIGWQMLPALSESDTAVPAFEPLEYGASGELVSYVQQRLSELGYYDGKISGNFLEGTRNCLKRLQKDYGLEITGKLDEETWQLLLTAQYRVLKNGDDGDEVARLQQRLIDLGYLDAKATGKFRSATEGAVKNFQKQNGLDVTGVADLDTQQRLFGESALAKGVSPTPTPDPMTDAGDINDVVIVGDGESTEDSRENVPFARRMTRGTQSENVKKVQTRLKELGFFDGPISGYYMDQTIAAVKKFQEYNGLPIDADMDEETWNQLFNAGDVVDVNATPRPSPEPTLPPYYVVVDVTNQVTKVYSLDENNEYTVLERQMICSTGVKGWDSDLGDWVTNGRRARWCYFSKWGGHAQYWTRINENIAFHSVTYSEPDTRKLNVKSYNKLGRRASHGCIRMLVSDAKWMYDNIKKGTTVHITEDLPLDEELTKSLLPPDLDKKYMLPKTTPEPTAEPAYTSDGTPPQPFRTLKKGSKGEDVYWLQRKLADLGYYQGAVTGEYWSGTADAVKAYQKDQGLKADGIAAKKTLEALYADVLNTETAE